MKTNEQIIKKVLEELLKEENVWNLEEANRSDNKKSRAWVNLFGLSNAIRRALELQHEEFEKLIDEEFEIVKSRPTKGIPILKLGSMQTLTKLKQKLLEKQKDENA